ncbi:MAG TPA: hypothetical protein VG895_04585 [Patescibacteria group bacterium]|nr:hypothetical protein [Patescibacteria group bacterium]
MKLKLVVLLSLILGSLSLLFINKNVFARDGGPAASDPDINITLRNWKPANFPNQLIDHPQNTDLTGAPQLLYTFGSPNFTNFYQINAVGSNSPDSSNVNSPGAATISFQSGDDIKAPVVGRSIGSGFNYTILYATSTDIVIHNGLEDSVASGYTIHFLNINVNPTLLQMYNDNEAKGRTQLVAIPCGYVIGTASGDPFVSIRDTGSFMDPRFKDWWSSDSPGVCNDVPPGYVTAGSSTQPATNTEPYDLSTNVPCNETNYDIYKSTGGTGAATEFHSLRPYPASPCYKQTPPSEMAALCSNDLVVIKQTSPNSAYQTGCTTPAADGSYSCNYANVPESAQVSIDLTGAQLPILGNTQDVPNGTWTSPNTSANNLDAAQRVNNYVSWYLNGVVDKAENDFSSSDPNYLVNYSGPLNKLLPFVGQILSRENIITRAANSVAGPATSTDEQGLHNKIVECDFPEQAGSMPCYLYTITRFISFLQAVSPNNTMTQGQGDAIANLSTIRRITDWVGHTPPLEQDFSTVSGWLQAYSQWLGNICITPIFGCPTTPSTWWAKFFAFVPFSTNEDRVGTIGTNQIANTTPANNSCRTTGAPCSTTCANGKTFSDSCPGNGSFDSCSQWAQQACGTVNSTPLSNNGDTTSFGQTNPGDVTFTPSNGTNNIHNLYFAHAQEDTELATQLQNTFKSIDATSSHDTNTAPQIGPGCTILNTRTNPGDNLYGDIDRTKAQGYAQDDQKISGTVNFTGSYTCTFKPIVSVSGSTFENGGGISGNLTYTCTSATANLSIYTQSPEVGNIWDQLVGGSQSIFKRFFPQTGANSPVTQITETPAQTNITYQAGGDDEVTAGNSGGGGATATANLYIPYVGGIKDYFLDAIQTALRPQGMGTSPALTASSNSSSSSSGPISCTPDDFAAAFGDQAKNASCIANAESRCIPDNHNLSCLKIGGTQDYSYGLFGINLLAHPAIQALTPPDLKQQFDSIAQSEGKPAGYYWTCKQGFTTIGIADASGHMISPCVIGDQAIVDKCVQYYSNAQNNMNYAAAFEQRFGWKYWGTAPQCGL